MWKFCLSLKDCHLFFEDLMEVALFRLDNESEIFYPHESNNDENTDKNVEKNILSA